ncbi:MAG: HEAT repeat domain-containing protein [Nitrospirota bacterium]
MSFRISDKSWAATSFLLIFILFSSIGYSEEDQLERIIQNLNSEYRDLRMSSVWILGKVQDPRAVKTLIKALKHKDFLIRVKAAEALGDKKEPAAVEPIITLLKDEEEMVREAAATALGNITGKDFGQDSDKWYTWWEQNKRNILQ